MATSQNFQRAARKLAAFSDAMRSVAGDAVVGIGGEIMDDAKGSGPGRGVPVAVPGGGKLRDSGDVTQRSKRETVLSFGGGDVDYALLVHEDMDSVHEIGEARYLTRALDRWRPASSRALKEFRRAAARTIRRIGAR